jgi:hypothetical protein
MTCCGLLFRSEAGGFQRDGDSATRTFRVIFFTPVLLAKLVYIMRSELTWCDGRLLISIAPQPNRVTDSQLRAVSTK